MTHELRLWQVRFGEYLGLRGAAERTRAAYTAELKPFFSFLAGRGVENLAQLSREHLEAYRQFLYYSKHQKKSLQTTTQMVRLQALKRFTRFLTQRGFLLLDVGAGLEVEGRRREGRRVVLTEAETLRLLHAPNPDTTLGLRDRALLETLYGTGLRNSEVSHVSLQHVDLAQHLLRVVRGKGGRDRVVPLGQEAEHWLGEYLGRSRPKLLRQAEETRVFLTRHGRPFRRSELAELVSRWARRAGLAKHVTPHTLRHSCAAHMLRRGAQLEHLQRLLGHACPDSTERYTPVQLSDLRQVLLRCHPRARQRRTP